MKIRPLLTAALPAALLLCTLQTPGVSAHSPTGTQSKAVAEEFHAIIHYRNEADMRRIAGRFQHPRVDRQARTIKVAIDAYDMADLRRMGLRVDIDRVGTARLRSMNEAFRTGRFGARALSDFACYRTVENTHSAMTALATSKPALAKVMNLGPTWKKWTAGGTNGYEMQVLRLTNSATDAIRSNKPAMVLLSSIHAREYAPAEFNMRFGEWLVNGYGTDAEATWLLDNYVFYLIPQGNPDGRKIAENGTSWRKNINNTNGSCPASQTGVDLNRNFPFYWGTLDDGPTSSNACVETYRGPSSASEQETQNIMRLIAGTRGASGSYTGGIFADRRTSGLSSAAPDDTQGVFIDLHSYSGEVLWPWGMVNSLAPNHAGLQTLGRRMAFYNKYSPYQSVKFYPTAGSTDDTMYGELGVASYTWELGSNLVSDTAFFQPCSSFLSTILPDNLNALKYTARILTKPYRYPAGPETVSVSASAASVPASKSITVAAGTPVTVTAVLDDGVWGQIVHTPADPTHRIASARAYIDTPPWEAGASGGIAMTASDGSFSSARETVTASISTTGLSPGRHLIYVQGVDDSGQAGAPNAVLVNITSGGGGSGNVLSNGVAVTGLSGAKGAELRYTLQVPAGATNLRFVTSGGSGDADLYIKYGSAPTAATGGFDLKSDGNTNSETINVATAQAGTYHVLVRGYEAFSGLGLTGSYTAGSGGGSVQTYTNPTGQALPALATITSDIVVTGRSGNGPVDAKIAVDITHTYRGDVVIDLIAPNGIVIPLKSSAVDSLNDVKVTYARDLSSYTLNGTWRLRVQDVDAQDSGRLNNWSITF